MRLNNGLISKNLRNRMIELVNNSECILPLYLQAKIAEIIEKDMALERKVIQNNFEAKVTTIPENYRGR